MAAPRSPQFRLTVYAEQYPSSGGTDTLVSAMEDLSQAVYAEGRVVEFGAIDRQISDPSGEHYLGQAVITHADTDHFWRARGAAATTRFLEGRYGTIDVISPEAYALSVAPTILMRGKLAGLDLEDDLGATLALEELIGSEFGPAFLDKDLNPRKFRAQIFPDVDRDLMENPIPIIVGEVSDSGALNPDGTPGAKGMCPGTFVGSVDINGSTVTWGPPTLLAAPSWTITYTKFGSGGSHTYTYAVSVRTATGRTLLGGYVTITGLPATEDFSPSNGVTLNLAQYPDPADQALVTGIDLYVKDGGSTSSAPYHYMDAAGQMFNTAPGVPFVGGVGYDDDGDDSHYKTRNPPPTTNTATNGNSWGAIIFADSAVQDCLELWGGGWENEDTLDDGQPPKRVQWVLGGMDDVLDPLSGGWPYPDPFIDITGTDGVVERFWGIFVKGPRLQHHINGDVTIAGNFCGREEVGDGTGLMIDQFAFVWQHLLSEQVFGNNGLSYHTGNWVGLPLFADGIEGISSPSVQAIQTQSGVFLGTAEGYLSAFCLTKSMTVREFLQEWNRTFATFSYINRHGQLSLSMVNTAASPTAGTVIRQDIEAITVSAPTSQRESLENQIAYQFDWDADGDRYRSDVLPLKSPDSQEAFGAGGHLTVRERGTYDGFFTRDLATMAMAMRQRLLLYDQPPRVATIKMGTDGFGIDLFDQVLVTGYEGYGDEGYDAQPMLVIGHKVMPGRQGVVELTVWDLGDILTRTFGTLV